MKFGSDILALRSEGSHYADRQGWSCFIIIYYYYYYYYYLLLLFMTMRVSAFIH